MEQNHRLNRIGQNDTGQDAWTFHALEHNFWSGGYDRLSECNCFLEGCDGQFPALCGKQRPCPRIAHWENEGKLFGYYY